MAFMSKLRLIGIRPANEAISCEIGKHYIPLSICLPYGPKLIPLYWSLVDPVFCLVEVGLDPNSGQLLKFTVVNYNSEILVGHTVTMNTQQQSGMPCFEQKGGIPCFDLSPWSTNIEPDTFPKYKTYSGRCKLWYAAQTIHVELFDDKMDMELVMNERVTLSFNTERELIAVSVNHLSEQEYATIGYYNKA